MRPIRRTAEPPHWAVARLCFLLSLPPIWPCIQTTLSFHLGPWRVIIIRLSSWSSAKDRFPTVCTAPCRIYRLSLLSLENSDELNSSNFQVEHRGDGHRKPGLSLRQVWVLHPSAESESPLRVLARESQNPIKGMGPFSPIRKL